MSFLKRVIGNRSNSPALFTDEVMQMRDAARGKIAMLLDFGETTDVNLIAIGKVAPALREQYRHAIMHVLFSSFDENTGKLSDGPQSIDQTALPTTLNDLESRLEASKRNVSDRVAKMKGLNDTQRSIACNSYAGLCADLLQPIYLEATARANKKAAVTIA